MPSPLNAWPVVMLNGLPDCIWTNGATCILKGSPTVPPKYPRCRISKFARPQSRLFVVLIHREAIGVAVSLAVRVVALQLEVRIDARAGIERHLELFEDAAGFVLINVAVGVRDACAGERPHTGIHRNVAS